MKNYVPVQYITFVVIFVSNKILAAFQQEK